MGKDIANDTARGFFLGSRRLRSAYRKDPLLRIRHTTPEYSGILNSSVDLRIRPGPEYSRILNLDGPKPLKFRNDSR